MRENNILLIHQICVPFLIDHTGAMWVTGACDAKEAGPACGLLQSQTMAQILAHRTPDLDGLYTGVLLLEQICLHGLLQIAFLDLEQ